MRTHPGGKPEHRLDNADEWFWPLVDTSGGPDACWPWTGQRDEKGYGRVWVSGRKERMHRVAFALVNGRMPVGLGCHTCNNPPCCNPRHVYDGTPLSNTEDRRRAGVSTSRPGEANHEAKLSERDARAIRESPSPATVLAEHYGVSRRTVWLIRTGRAWKHLGDGE